MKQPATPSQIAVRGLAAGFVATQVLDIVSAFLYENLSPQDRLDEDRARSGHQAYEMMAKNVAEKLGFDLREEQIKYFGWKFHRAFGFSGGVQYMAAREKYPAIGAWGGFLYGLGFYALADQGMIYATKSTPGPQNFNWRAHLRGAIAHIAYGVAMEMTARSFDRIADYENGVGWGAEEDKGNPKLTGREPIRTSAKTPIRAGKQRRGLQSSTAL